MEQKLKYAEIFDWIREKIKSQELKPGERIYSENELMEIFGVSRQTVRHAISKLEFMGFVERRRGSGTYICQKKSMEKTVSSMQIAVVTTYIDQYIFPKIIQKIDRTISKEGYTIQIASTNNSIEKERDILKKLLHENTVDGIIIESTKSALPNPNLPLYQEIIERKIPLVFLNSYYKELAVPHVSMNDKMAGKLAAQYLIARGHQKLGAIFKSDDGQGHLRYAGFVEALREAGIPVKEEHIIWITTEDQKCMQEDAQRYIRRLKENTAYVCYNDKVANEFMEICLKHNIRIPDEISIIGIDDAEIAQHARVPLTSVHNPVGNLGEMCATVMLKMIHGSPVEKDYELVAKLVERESTMVINP